MLDFSAAAIPARQESPIESVIPWKHPDHYRAQQRVIIEFMRFTRFTGLKPTGSFEEVQQNVGTNPAPGLSEAGDADRRTRTIRRKPVLVIVGAGPVGQRLSEELIGREAWFDIKVFGDEPYEPYNRVYLSSLLAGSAAWSDLLNPLFCADRKTPLEYINSRIIHINPEQKRLTDQQGLRYRYDRLVLATGSHAFVPTIPGTELAGVYTFRTLRDAESLCARRSRARRIVVVGGGLLGLETANALAKHSTEITLVQQAERVMNRQLDEGAAAELQRRVESKGIRLILGQGVRLIKGDRCVEAVTTRYGECIPCDTVVFCTGIEANVELARNSGIRIRRGILVDDHLQTSLPDIFAIGECSEHRGNVYGLVAPGLEQAAVLADHLTGRSARYFGSQQVSRLKIVGEEVTSIGEATGLQRRSSDQHLVYVCKRTGDYRKLVVRHGRLLGACGVGSWAESRRIQEAVQNQRYVYPWQRWKFRFSGRLWNDAAEDGVRLWPNPAIVCQCNRVDRGTLGSAIAAGCDSLESIKQCTGAGSTCGTCAPLILSLLAPGAAQPRSKSSLALAGFSVLSAIAVALIGSLPAIEPPNSVTGLQYQITWTDGFWKQFSGYTVVGLTLLGMTLSFKKRWGWNLSGDFEHWRIVHSILGCLALGVLFFHTGAALGTNLNQLLILNYLVVAAVGALTGGVVAWANRSGSLKGPRLRRCWLWIHLLVAWPLPILLSVHILTVYYF